MLYRDCGGIPISNCTGGCGSSCSVTLQMLGADPSCSGTPVGAGSIICTLDNVRDVDANLTCPTSKNVCTTMGCVTAGTFTPSIERYEFKGTVNLGPSSGIPSSCCNVRFSFQECCRNSVINNINSGNFYTEATINRCLSLTPCNSSPKFTNDPYVVICANENFVYNHGTIELDRDSLSFEFTPALEANNTLVTYIAPWAYNTPMPWHGAWNGPFPQGIRCDPNNGDIMFKPGNAGSADFVGVMAVKMTQWKHINGIMQIVGTTRRDIQTYIRPTCSPNNPPYLTTNPPLSSTSPNAPKLSWETCEGSQLCFDVLANDTDSISTTIMDSTYLSWDNAIASLGATFTPNYIPGAKPRIDSYKFCWTPAAGIASNTPYLFTIKASDSKCPIPGRIMRAFSVKVKGVPTAAISKNTAQCGKWRASYTNATPSIPISSAFWKIAKAPFDTAFASGADTFSNITTTPFKQYNQPGKYLIQLTLNNGSCSRIQYDTLFVDTIVKATAINDTMLCSGSTLQLNVTAQYGRAPYFYRWYNSIRDTALFHLNISLTTTTHTVLPITDRYYTIQVRDADGCRSYDSVLVKQNKGIKNTTITTPKCFAESNGSIAVTMLDSLMAYQYKLGSGSFQSATIFTGLAAGTYSITTKDSLNCTTTTNNITITQPALLRDTLTTVTNETCKGLNNGTLTTLALGGKTPYRYSIDSTTFGVTRVFANLVPTTYKIHILDSNNCYTTTTRTIAAADSFYAATVTTNPTCFNATNGEIRTQGIGGKAPYTYSLGTTVVFNNDSIFENLPASTYTVNIKDNNNCAVIFTKTLTQPQQIVASVTQLNPTCNNRPDGSITITTTQGKAPFTYALDAGLFSTTNTFTNLVGNTYTVSVKDSFGCNTPFAVVLPNPSPIVAGSITGNQLVTKNAVHTYSVPSQAGLNFVWAQQKGSIVSGKNTPIVNILWDSIGTGIVGVAVYSDTACGDTVSMPITIGANSLAEIASQLGLEIFPNPSTGIINITLQTLPTNRILKLYDIQGKLMLEQELKLSQQLNIERQPQGVYMLKIADWFGQVVKE